VGIRDFSEGENKIATEPGERVVMFTDHAIKRSLFEGITWKKLSSNIIHYLPEKIYISFDIDGLQPWLCPNTGTPVPGGLLLEETFYLLEKVVESGRQIIGFDLVEVSPGEDEWDGNVGARVLYKLCLLAAKSNGLEL
jgi:agmatinase